MAFGTVFDVGIDQKLLVITNVALKNYPSLKFVLGQLVSDQEKHVDSSDQKIFANQEFQSQGKRHATLFGAECTAYQPEMICLDPFGETSVCVISLL